MNIYCGSFLDEEFDKFAKDVWGVEKFDVIIGNPPYQSESAKRNKGSGHTLWNKFCIKSISIMEEDACLSFVHPSGWRNISGAFSAVKEAYQKNDLLYLEIHNIKDGKKTFGAATRYDWYVLRKSFTEGLETEIVFEDGETEKSNIKQRSFIPNFLHEKLSKVLADSGQEKINLVYSRSAYGADKKHISKEKTVKNIFPCIKYISQKDETKKLVYSSTKENGHFGIKKVVFGTGAGLGGVYIDENGEYGLCQFSCGVAADGRKELENIKKAITSKTFKELMKACQFTTELYNRKAIALFRKDFWKEFIDV
jgi:hypothetical protein